MTPRRDADDRPAGWLSAGEELAIYEGLRLGEEAAFRALATALQPTLRRLVGLHVTGDEAVDAVVRRSWRTVLQGDHMFRWQTPLATWIAGIAVTGARGHGGPAPGHGGPARRAHGVGASGATSLQPGPSDWSDLPWSGRWQGVGRSLDEALAALDPADLEVLHGRDVEGWPVRCVCDVFGLPEAAASRRLTAARRAVHDQLARHVGQRGPGPPDAAQLLAVTRWLGEHRDPRPEPLDPRTVEVFRRWAARRDGRWSRLIGRLGDLSRWSAGPAGRRGAPASATASDRPTPT